MNLSNLINIAFIFSLLNLRDKRQALVIHDVTERKQAEEQFIMPFTINRFTKPGFA